MVAHWADLHHPDRHVGGHAGGVRVRVGADGTPVVSEFACTALGVALETTTGSATALLRDALELRHRMPCLWAAVMAGQVEDWKARKVVALTRVLTEDQCAWVDNQVVEALVGLPFGRALGVIEGKVIAADPQGHERRRVELEQKRFVALGRRSPAGVQSLFARGAVGDMVRLMAMVNHLADKLLVMGDTDSADERRAKALGILANPALACVLMLRTEAEEAAPASVAEPADPQEPEHPTAVHEAIDVGRALEGLSKDALERLRPRSVLFLHIDAEAVGRETGVVRCEGLGAIGIAQLREWLRHDRVVVKPVAYPLEQAGVDSYEIPQPLADAVRLVRSYEVFPWGTLPARQGDLDHSKRYRRRPREPGSPPQTRLGNLGPLGRTHHRAKTFGGFTLRQPSPGVYYWQVPTGRWYCVDRSGTRALGHQTPDAVAMMDEPVGSPAEQHLARVLAA